jgi:hypothetical protein
MKSALSGLLTVLVIILLLPSIIALFCWTAIYGVLLVPVLAIGYLIWRRINMKKDTSPIPADAKEWVPKPPRKPIMIKWRGKEIPLGVFIFSIVLSIILVPIFILCLLFIFPPVLSACIIGFLACRKIDENVRKEKA